MIKYFELFINVLNNRIEDCELFINVLNDRIENCELFINVLNDRIEIELQIAQKHDELHKYQTKYELLM